MGKEVETNSCSAQYKGREFYTDKIIALETNKNFTFNNIKSVTVD
jgi:hypothetical protein